MRLFTITLLAGAVAVAGCGGGATPGGGGSAGGTTAPPATTAPPSSAPLLDWPYTTSVNVTHAVKVPPVPVLVNVRAGLHQGYDRIVFEFAGPIPSYRIQPVAQLAEDASGEPVLPTSRNLEWVRLEPDQGHTDAGKTTLTGSERHGQPGWPALREYQLIGDFEGVVSYGLRLGLAAPNLRVFELTEPNRLVVDIAHQRLPRR